MSKDKPIILAVGSTGSIGRHVVASGLAHGYAVLALVRDARAAGTFPPETEIVVEDLTREATLSEAAAGIDGIVFTQGTYGNPTAAEAVDYGGVRNLLAALKGRKARVALTTAIGTTDRKGSHDWKRRAERLVRASGLLYTIVRPAWFDYNEPDQNQIVMLQGDKQLAGNPSDGVIARRQIAEVLVRSLSSDAALRKTFELHSEKGPEQEDFDPVFAALEADPTGAVDGARDLSNMPPEHEPARIMADMDSVKANFAG